MTSSEVHPIVMLHLNQPLNSLDSEAILNVGRLVSEISGVSNLAIKKSAPSIISVRMAHDEDTLAFHRTIQSLLAEADAQKVQICLSQTIVLKEATLEESEGPTDVIAMPRIALSNKASHISTSMFFRCTLRVLHVYRDTPTDARVYFSGENFNLPSVWDPHKLLSPDDEERLYEVTLVRTKVAGAHGGRASLAILKLSAAIDESKAAGLTAMKSAHLCFYYPPERLVLLLRKAHTECGADLAWRLRAFWSAEEDRRQSYTAEQLLARIKIETLSDDEVNMLAGFEDAATFKSFFGDFMFKSQRLTAMEIHQAVSTLPAFTSLVSVLKAEKQRRHDVGVLLPHDAWVLTGGATRTRFLPHTDELAIERTIDAAARETKEEIGVHVTLNKEGFPSTEEPLFQDVLRHDNKFKLRVYPVIVTEQEMNKGLRSLDNLNVRNDSDRCFLEWVPLDELPFYLKRLDEYGLASRIKDICTACTDSDLLLRICPPRPTGPADANPRYRAGYQPRGGAGGDGWRSTRPMDRKHNPNSPTPGGNRYTERGRGARYINNDRDIDHAHDNRGYRGGHGQGHRGGPAGTGPRPNYPGYGGDQKGHHNKNTAPGRNEADDDFWKPAVPPKGTTLQPAAHN